MTNSMSISGLAAAALLLCGCSVMHFQNGDVDPKGFAKKQWHHNVALSLVEVSSSVDLQTLCNEGPWARVSTYESFGTGVVGYVDEFVEGFVSPITFDLWDPQMVEYTCGK